MADIVSPKVRSRMMSGIKGKNTKPEIMIRKALYSKGFRYRLHNSKLPGKPDLLFPKYGAVIQINGCFWHKHECHLFKWPKSRKEFWHPKLMRNQQKDEENNQALEELGWRILTVWECALKGKERLEFDELISKISRWLKSDSESLEIRGASRA